MLTGVDERIASHAITVVLCKTRSDGCARNQVEALRMRAWLTRADGLRRPRQVGPELDLDERDVCVRAAPGDIDLASPEF